MKLEPIQYNKKHSRLTLLLSVYAVLYCDVCFSFAATLLNAALALAPKSMKCWFSIVTPVNFMCQLFHVVSWSVVSVQRYFYIVKGDWLYQKFPETHKLMVGWSHTTLQQGTHIKLGGEALV